MFLCFFFFFKQKTAYEIKECDWSSDVCSSDLSSTIFEGANIIVYTTDIAFFKNGDAAIKDVVNNIKKRIELRADKSLLMSQEETEKRIREIIPEESELTQIIFDPQRSTLILETKKPGLAIGKGGFILKEIKQATMWTPQVQRSSAIPSKITEKIREVLYQDNSYRKKFLNNIGEKIYKGWNPEKMEEWVRITALGGGRQVGRSCFLLQTPISKILIDCGVDVSSNDKNKYPYLEVPEFDLTTIDAVIISHAHLDHSGLVPYLYKMGYKGPVYMTAPTRDIAALMALDFIGVAYKQAAAPLFKSTDIRSMVKHSISLNYCEVTDITPDVRITLYNAGHTLGSAMIHFNIGNGLHNYVYSGDIKFGKSRSLEAATSYFPRIETLQLESTYGGKDCNYPRSEERRVGKECRSRWSPYHEKKKNKRAIDRKASGRERAGAVLPQRSPTESLLPLIQTSQTTRARFTHASAP